MFESMHHIINKKNHRYGTLKNSSLNFNLTTAMPELKKKVFLLSNNWADYHPLRRQKRDKNSDCELRHRDLFPSCSIPAR